MPRLLLCSILSILLLSGCAPPPESCPPFSRVDLSDAAAYAGDASLPFRFPLDEHSLYTTPFMTDFATPSRGGPKIKYHAAEDFRQPPGTPVYAMADGKVSFSGPMDGYGWLIIVDHPQANLYSLYGHISPSRWRIRSGTVEKGELLAYLGDDDENGGSAKNPLDPHLHLGVRVGQRVDYSGMGEWRWMAGWITPCPQDVGWLQPSVVITSQDISAGGLTRPAGRLADVWGAEILLGAMYVVSAVGMLFFAIKRDRASLLLASIGVLIIVGWFFRAKGPRMSFVLFVMAVLWTVIGIYRFIRRPAVRDEQGAPPQG